MKKQRTSSCPQCGKEFSYFPSAYRGKNKQFCSRQCQSLASREHKKCPNCGLTFEFYKRYPRIYCSRKCSATVNIHRQLGIVALEPTTCEYCGKAIDKPLHKNRRFCSRYCFGQWQSANVVGENHPTYSRVKSICLQCGKEFITKKCEVVKGWGKFCSQNCKSQWQVNSLKGENNPHWKGGIAPYYGPNWFQARRNARHRDSYICQRCGKSEKELGQKLDVHHIVPLREFIDSLEANKMANLISLCRSCHPFVEAHGLH